MPPATPVLLVEVLSVLPSTVKPPAPGSTGGCESEPTEDWGTTSVPAVTELAPAAPVPLVLALSVEDPAISTASPSISISPLRDAPLVLTSRLLPETVTVFVASSVTVAGTCVPLNGAVDAVVVI